MVHPIGIQQQHNRFIVMKVISHILKCKFFPFCCILQGGKWERVVYDVPQSQQTEEGNNRGEDP
jgi:hypothetical protein